MKKVIKISQKNIFRYSNIIGIMIIILGIVLGVIFRSFPEIIFFSFAVIFLTYALLLSYRIRYIPNTIILDEDKISIEYLSKGLFKQELFRGNTQDVNIRNEKNRIILAKDDKIIALIKKDSINEDDKIILINRASNA